MVITAWQGLEGTSVGHPVQLPCRSRVTYSRLHRTLSRWVLSISREGDSTTSWDSLCQCYLSIRSGLFSPPLPTPYPPFCQGTTAWWGFRLQVKHLLGIFGPWDGCGGLLVSIQINSRAMRWWWFGYRNDARCSATKDAHCTWLTVNNFLISLPDIASSTRAFNFPEVSFMATSQHYYSFKKD